MSDGSAQATTTPGRTLRTLAGRNRTKADIVVRETPSGALAVKDYSPRPWWIRQTLGRFLVRREATAYGTVGDVPGLARFAGRLGPFTLATEWIEARPLATFADGSVPPARFDRLREIVETLHARGLALADLNHRDVLLAEDGSVHVIDLAASWRLGPRPGRLRRALFERFRGADLFALARLRARFTGTKMSDVIGATSPVVLAWHRRARRLKWRWDRLRGIERLPPVEDHWRF